MRLEQFEYHLPQELVAQRPAVRRDASRLMVVPRREGPLAHLMFADLAGRLRRGDLLVLNDTRVIAARLRGVKESGGRVEILLDRPLDQTREEDGAHLQRYSCLVGSAKPLRAGTRVLLPDGGEALLAERSSEREEAEVILRLPKPLLDYLERRGEVPLPPYIRREPGPDPRAEMDRDRYQTVYARNPGAVAAPTAGLHFTEELLAELRSGGVEVAALTLHVGPGTFLPVRVAEVERHRMPAERFGIDAAAAAAVTAARAERRRVVAVGTTVARALESAWDGERLRPGAGETDLFIRPGYVFKAVDALLTNFHLPRSTLLMLVCAFSETGRILAAYREAVQREYRFYSYGDAMFLE